MDTTPLDGSAGKKKRLQMNDVNARFGACEICSSNEWQEVYRGAIRDGSFGNLSDPDTVVAECQDCGVQRLEERRCKEEEAYEGEHYRRLVGEPTDVAGYRSGHDGRMLKNLSLLLPETLRDKKIVDVGCAAGSFLDYMSGLTKKAVAIEPCKIYHDALKSRGYHVYAYSKDALAEHEGSIDLAFSWEVIEHVGNPRIFLEEIARLLKPNGRAMISTPNRKDVLMALLPDEYPAFFYRVVHRWYFDEVSLRRCAFEAGLKVVNGQFVHRFGLSNAMRWLRDKRPGGREPLPQLNSALVDKGWVAYLEDRGIADYLYFVLERPA